MLKKFIASILIAACLFSMASLMHGCKIRFLSAPASVPSSASATSTVSTVTVPTTVTIVPTSTTTAVPTTVIPTTVPEPTTIPTTVTTVWPTLSTTLPPPAYVTQNWLDPNYRLSAPYAFVYDGDAEQMLFAQGNFDAKVYPASLTKLFTAYVVLLHMDPDTEITIGKEIDLVPYYSSLAGLYYGDRLTIQMLLKAMLIPSGNDAAFALACATGYALAENKQITPAEAVEVFMAEVNAQLQARGLTGSHFLTPAGLPNENHYTSPRDLLAISQLAMSNPIIRQIVGTSETTVTFLNGRTKTWRSSNYLLHSFSKYYCPDAVGMKTGTTEDAGCCLITAYPSGDDFTYIIILKSWDYNLRFSDTLWLYNRYVKDGS